MLNIIYHLRKNFNKKNLNIGLYRILSQFLIVIICIWAGFEFKDFIKYLESEGIEGSNYRPPAAEGFLPISSLMSLYYFFLTGEIHSYHPAGFFIFVAVLIMSLILGKSFCSWICPIGFLSESLGDFGEKLFKRKIKMPKILDYFFRSLKYFLLLFFLSAIFSMSEKALKSFLDSDYNFMADVKMFYFFAEISQFSLIVISALIVLSVIFRNFWCRYLCPYGALLGVIGLISPIKIKRDKNYCIDCGKCSKVCSSFIQVDKVNYVISDECVSCSKCIDACPVKEALEFSIYQKKIKRKLAPLIALSSFWIIIIIAIILGRWKNNQPLEKYLELNKKIESLNHPRSAKEARSFENK